MFGSELALVETNPLKRLQYKTIGVTHIGGRLRFNYLNRAIAELDLPADATVLNAGSGKGEHSFHLARQNPGWSITGVEIDQEKVALTEEIRSKLGLGNVRFVCADLMELDEREAYDLIFCMDVLEHIEDDIGFMAKVRAMLKPGGRFILHVPGRPRPCRIPFSNLVERNRHGMFEEDHGHVREGYDNDDLQKKIERAGLLVLSLVNPTGYWGQLASDIYALFEHMNLMKLLSYPFVSALVALDSLERNTRPYPYGAGVMVVAARGAGKP
jgi:SAM-dependent methyltransferase